MSEREHQAPDLRDLLDQHSSERSCVELCPICRAADVLRATTSGDGLRDGWQDVQREALLTMKAVIDRQVERLDADEPEPGTGIEEIRID